MNWLFFPKYIYVYVSEREKEKGDEDVNGKQKKIKNALKLEFRWL